MRAWRGLRAWWRWEMGREIEVTPVIRLIVVERYVKGGLLLLGGLALLVAGSATDLHRVVEDWQTQINLSPGRGLVHRAVTWVVQRLGSVSVTRERELAAAAMLYGLLEVVEGTGLVLRRRWAEYLVVVATGAFLPVEVDELVRRPTPLKALALLVNAAIVGYLVWRKRLFMERPGRTPAGAPA